MKAQKRKKIVSIILIILIFVLGFFLGNIFTRNQMANRQESTSVTQIVEANVGTQTIENTLTSSGDISASNSEKLSLSTSKYFKVMCVEEDDLVAEGEEILQYSNGTYLVAPYDCHIASISVPETGSKCTSNNYIEIENVATMIMNLQISESEINQVKEGQEVEISLSAIEDKTYLGTIQSVSSVGNYSNSGTTFEAVVSFENDGNAKIGMSASCSVILAKAENVIAVPIEAVQTKNENKYVICVKEDGSTEEVIIETGISNDSYVQVISGLEGTETIQMTQTVSSNSSVRNMTRGSSQNSGMQSGGFTPGEMSGMEMPNSGQTQGQRTNAR